MSRTCDICKQPILPEPEYADATLIIGTIGWEYGDDTQRFYFHKEDCYEIGRQMLLEKLKEYRHACEIRGLGSGKARIEWFNAPTIFSSEMPSWAKSFSENQSKILENESRRKTELIISGFFATVSTWVFWVITTWLQKKTRVHLTNFLSNVVLVGCWGGLFMIFRLIVRRWK